MESDSRLTLRCLSQPALLAPDGEPVRFRTRKHFALLVYLAVERRTVHRRDRLADLLWGSAPPAEGRHSLATALSVLRNKLGRGALECTPETVRFVHPALDVDLDRLIAGDVLASGGRPPLEVAGFLDGFEVADAAEFMLWKDQQQAHWLPDIKRALVTLMDLRRRTGDFRAIEGLADRMLSLDPLSEEAIRAKMEARAFAGDRLTALRVYEAWEAQLAEELGAQPSALVEGMAIRLRRRGWERELGSPIPTVPTDQWKDRPFVGRAEEYRALYEGWERTQRGEPGHAFILGDSGIGKSTLAERLCTAAGLEGAAVSRVQCYEVERDIPYAALGTLVVGLLEKPGVTGTSPEALAELSRTVPQVRRRFPGIPESKESQGETARFRLTEAFLELVTAIADEQPVILVVDDLHHADDASLGVVHLVMRRAYGVRVMVLLLARPHELASTPTASRLLERASDLALSVYEVSPIADEDATELIMMTIEPSVQPPPAGVCRALTRASAGYPMLLTLMVEDWLAHGNACIALAVQAMTADPRTDSGAPLRAYRLVISRTIGYLDAETRNILGLAAILGKRLNDISQYAVLDLGLGQVMAGLTRLRDLRLLHTGGGDSLEFANEIVRAHAYLAIPSSLRRALHSRVADRLINHRDGTHPSTGLEVAWHCIRANRADEATAYLISGAQEAIERGALHEAQLALSTSLPGLLGTAKREAQLLLAAALQEEGRWSDSFAVLNQVDREAAPIDDEHLTDALLTLARFSLGLVPDWEATEQLGTLRNHLLECRNPATKSWIARTAAHIAAHTRDKTCLADVLTTLNAVDTAGFRPTDRMRLQLSRAMMLYYMGDRPACLNILQHELEQANADRTPNSLGVSLLNGLGVVHCSEGDYEKAAESFVGAYEMAERLGNRQFSVVSAANAALCFGRIADRPAQLRWAERARRPLADHQIKYSHILAEYAAADAKAALGYETEATELVQSMLGQLDAASKWMRQAIHLYAAEIFNRLAKRRLAEHHGRLATSGENYDLHSGNFAGLYATWVANLASAQTAERDKKRISTLVGTLSRYDNLDQTMIRSAEQRLNQL